MGASKPLHSCKNPEGKNSGVGEESYQQKGTGGRASKRYKKTAKNIQLSGKEAMRALVLTQGMRAVERRQDSSHPLASL
jgi:hypothetical protein